MHACHVAQKLRQLVKVSKNIHVYNVFHVEYIICPQRNQEKMKLGGGGGGFLLTIEHRRTSTSGANGGAE